jgi:nitrate/TMAO reductase-like tetraheme cytochrome c subunit
MLLTVKNFTRIFAVVTLMLGATMSIAQVSGRRPHDDHDSQKRTASNEKWVSECGACHVAYPPRMLPAKSWRAIMSGLSKHFGSDASLDAASANEITAFLEKNASPKKYNASGKPLLRITETRWFKSEHREVATRLWKSPKIKSPANCGACHTKAESGDFDEDNVKIPK